MAPSQTSAPFSPHPHRSRNGSGIKIRTITTHTATFLAGIFIATVFSTVHLTNNHFSYNLTPSSCGDFANSGADSFLKSSKATSENKNDEASANRLGDQSKYQKVSKDNESENLLLEEQRKTEELQREIENLRKINESPISVSSTTSEPNSMEEAFQQRLLREFQDYYKNNPDKNTSENNDMCSLLPNPTPSTLSLWSHFLPHILDSSKHAHDWHEYEFHDFTARLLSILTPDRLNRGVKTLPLDWTPIQRSLTILHKRWTAIQKEIDSFRKKNNLSPTDPIDPKTIEKLQKSIPNAPRKLNILIMGGSVTMGVVCHLNPVTTQTGKYSRRACAWPGRLNTFFPYLFGYYDLVNIDSLALGGTNTESGRTIWDYSILPDEIPYPDILINGYATNDMHYNSVQDAIKRNVTLEHSVFELSQSFIRQVLTPKKGCGHPPPLLLYLDDYLGNEQNEIRETMVSSRAIHELSGYYGIGSISYADVVRDIVYGDTREWWFSSNWYEKGDYERAVHPHMGMHIGTVWVVGYYLLNLMTTYCSLPRDGNRPNSIVGKSLETFEYNPQYGLPPLREPNKNLVGNPKRKPRGLPPLLTNELSIEHVTQQWTEESQSNAHLWKSNEECIAEGHSIDEMDHAPLPKPCLLSWVANLERHLDNPKRLEGKLQPFISSNEGWIAADDNGKLGWVPSSGLGSRFAMNWKSISQPVKAVTWMIMRSYGEKWAGSTLNVQVYSGGVLFASEDIVGFHDKHTSETYNIKMKLDGDGVTVGSDLTIKFQLTGGSTFKISGMAICDH